MSLALIEESAKEIRRLAIAGSPLAVGDFRIKKLVAPLEQAGAKVPVFAQVAKAINDLVNGTEAESAARLLALSTLLNAILYTQGQTTVTAPFTDLEVFVTNCTSTRATARVLKPIMAALTTASTDRMRLVLESFDHFKDLRMIEPAIQALDAHPKLANIMEGIVTGYGPGIIPRLKAQLNLKGYHGDSLRLKIMHKLDPEGTLELCKTALDEGVQNIKVTAICCLGEHEECVPLIMEYAHAKNQTLRSAALECLAVYDRPEIVKLFHELIKGELGYVESGALGRIRSREVLQALLEEGQRVFDLLLKGDSEQIPRFERILTSLRRKEPEVENFLLSVFTHSRRIAEFKPAKNSTVSGVDLLTSLPWMLYHFGSAKSLEVILAKRKELPPRSFGILIRSALLTWPSAKVFEEFSPAIMLNQTAATENVGEIVQLLGYFDPEKNPESDELEGKQPDARGQEWLRKVRWDPRWLDAAIKADQPVLVRYLARPGHQGALSYLLPLLEVKAKGSARTNPRAIWHQPCLIIESLARCQYPKLTDVFLKTIEGRVKGLQHFDSDLQLLFHGARYLPPGDLPKLDAFAAKLDEKFVDKYLEALAPLRAANQLNQT